MTPTEKNMGEKILIVDDNEAGRYVKARILARADYLIVQAADGKKALELAAAEKPALVILDVKLPDMSGIEVCRHLKTRDPTMLVLQTSAAFTGKHDRAAGLVGGADSYLIEPIEPEELTATVEALLRLKRAEQELRRSQESLENKVELRTHELAEANERLREEIDRRTTAEKILRHAQKMDVLGQLTGGIAHDFNNLLGVILGNLESMRRRLGASGDPALRTFADNAFYGARRAAALTRQLLAFARRQQTTPKAISIGSLVDEMVSLLRQTLGERIAVETHVPEDLWPVFVDQGELEAAILNLAVNARDAMPDGGSLRVTLANETTNGKVGAGERVTIAVTDTGCGMSEDVIKYAFEPFFTTKDVGEGTGLGLSQVYGFVSQSGGSVGIESKVGTGTTVTLRLPRYDGAVAPETAERHFVPDSAATNNTVLVVEDDDHMRAHSVGVIRELGYRVEQASNGKSALALLMARSDIKLLFTDIGLPGGMDGVTLAAKAKEHNPRLKVLLTTGYAQSGLIMPSIPLPILTKPFTFAALGQKFRELFSEQPMRILLVEDEVIIRLDTAERLREQGFEVDEAGLAREASAFMATNPSTVDAVVVDIGLPDRKGDELAAELRTVNPALPIVIASGYASDALLARFAGDRRTVFVSKPYSTDDLARALKNFRHDA